MHNERTVPFFFDSAALEARAEVLAKDYSRATPFPHVVIDDFLPRDVIDGVLEEFPARATSSGSASSRTPRSSSPRTPKSAWDRRPATCCEQFNASAMCGFLEKLTGIDGLVPDPHFVGGGLHQIQPGGFLKVHADFNWHGRLQLYRRLNLLLYLNDDWSEEYGGHLELWDREMRTCVQRVLPVANRCVIFSTTSSAYHGHPTPLTCPEGRTRKSMALYYYSSARHEETQSEAHTTLFQVRPGSTDRSSTGGARRLLFRIAPPILVRRAAELASQARTLTRATRQPDRDRDDGTLLPPDPPLLGADRRRLPARHRPAHRARQGDGDPARPRRRRTHGRLQLHPRPHAESGESRRGRQRCAADRARRRVG